MTNLDAKICELRELMEAKYLEGDMESALALSQRLDRLIALAQRELLFADQTASPTNWGNWGSR